MNLDSFPLVRGRFERFLPLMPPEVAWFDALAGKSERVGARVTLLSEGRACDGPVILLDGWAIGHRVLPDGGRQVLRIGLPGELFGAECLLYRRSLYSVQTLTACSIVRVGEQELVSMRSVQPRLMEAFLLMMTFERAIAHEWTVSLGRRAGWSRVAHLLLELDERCRVSGIARRALPLTQQDIADCTGLTLGYVNRAIRHMRQRGLIESRPSEIVVLDSEALARNEGFQPRYLHPCHKVV